MSKAKLFRNTLAVILSSLIGFSLPAQVFATTLPKDETIYSSFDNVHGNRETIGDIITEISENRTETTKEFILDDGTKMIAEYSQPIHYINDKGKWVDYNNSLVSVSTTSTSDEADNEEYSNKNSNVIVKLSNKAKSNNMVKVDSDDYSISWGYDDVNKSKISITSNESKLVGNDRFTTLKNITSEAKYEDVYNNIDLQYFITPTGVKENIILKNSDVQNEFNITYKIKNLSAEQTDDYTISLYNKENKAVYEIVAPYMIDASGESSNSLKLELISQNGGNLNVKLTADNSFINDRSRSFPITIDPEITNKLSSSLTFYENLDGSVVSYGPYNTSINSYAIAKIKTLPTLEDGEKIISAKFNFEASNGASLFVDENDDPIIINAHKLVSMENGASQYDETVIDYDSLTYNDNKDLTFDLTKTLNDWYDNGEEVDGFILEAFDTIGSKQVNFQDATTVSVTPSLTLIYKDFTGTESNLTYHTVPVGENAQAAVCDYLGNLVINQSLYTGTGSRMPVTLTATYNSINYLTTFANGSPSGYGWQFSFNQSVRDASEALADKGYNYIYTDSDGTDHYLKKNGDNNEWYDEDGLGITLTQDDTNIYINNASKTQTYELTSNGGKLLSEKDEYNNTITYTYTDGNVTTITDGSGRTITINYYTNSNGAKRVRYIKLPDENRISIYYTSNTRDKISYIQFPDNRITRFIYSDDERIIAVEQAMLSTGIVVNSKVGFTYNAKAQVTNLTKYGSDGSQGDYINIVYGNDNTTEFTDRQNRKATYTFDNAGNQISILNGNGYLQSTGGSGFLVSSGADSFTKNYITESTEQSSIGNYYTKIDGDKDGVTSSGGTAEIDTSDYTNENGYVQYFGTTSIKINNPVTEDESAFYTGVFHQFNDTSFNGKDVTFSAYAKTKSVDEIYGSGPIGATLKIKCFDEADTVISEYNSVGITDTQDWQRLSVSVKVPSNTSYFRIYCNLRYASGTAWFDCLQLEEGNCVNDFNALQNADFESNEYWLTNEDEAISQQDGTVVISGQAGAYENAINVDEEEDENDDLDEEVQPATYYETVNETVPNDSIITYDDYGNTIKTEKGFVNRTIRKTYLDLSEIPDDETSTDSNEENTSTDEFIATQNSLGNRYIYQNVDVDRAGVSFNIVGEAQSKSVPLSNENRTFGIALNIYYKNSTVPETHYQEFNANTDKKQTVCLSIIPENNTQEIDYVAFAFVFGYNENTMTVSNAMLNILATGNLVNSETNNATEGEGSSNTSDDTEETPEDYCIDSEVVSESVDKSQPYMQTSSVYDSTGNYAISKTDEAGNITTYTYDVNGNVTSTTDGEENVVDYTYTAMGNVSQLKSYGAQNNYYYNGAGEISEIHHNDFIYSFNYDVFQNLINTRIGNVEITKNSYNSETGYLTKTTYANGDYLTYKYDAYGNVKSITGENGVFAEFVYNKKGLIAKAMDLINYQTIYYYYDFNGNSTSEYRQSQNGSLSYYLGHDNDGNVVEKTIVNGHVKTITRGSEENSTYVENDGITVNGTSDDFGRMRTLITSRGEGQSVFTTDYEYADGDAENSTTNLISKLTQSYGADELVNYEYTYNGNGNITRIKQNGTEVARYTYDELNQLVWSADRNTGLYTEFTYDNAGNITSVKEHTLSTSSWSPTSLKSEKVYVYNDANWKDKLTSYNGQNITYDEMGNPLSYRDGMSFAWINGRKLSAITTGDNTIGMKYDSNGMRIQKEDNKYVTNYYYDSENNLIGLDKSGTTLFFYYDSNGTPTSFSNNGVMYYYVKNLQGDIVKITKQDGTVVASYVYDVSGKLLSVKDSANDEVANSDAFHIANINPYRYRGYLYDTETGLYYLQTRYYDPIIGRFINADDDQYLMEQLLSSNMYTYCLNDPVSYVDYDGRYAVGYRLPIEYNVIGNSMAVDFYINAYMNTIFGYRNKLYDFSNNLYINKIKNTNAIRKFLFETFKIDDKLERMIHQHELYSYYEKDNSGKKYTLTLYNESYDLYLSIGDCKLKLEISKKDNNLNGFDYVYNNITGIPNARCYCIKITLYDDYNFEWWDKTKKNYFTKFVNNHGGFIMQKIGLITPYKWEIRFGMLYYYVCEHGY